MFNKGSISHGEPIVNTNSMDEWRKQLKEIWKQDEIKTMDELLQDDKYWQEVKDEWAKQLGLDTSGYAENHIYMREDDNAITSAYSILNRYADE